MNVRSGTVAMGWFCRSVWLCGVRLQDLRALEQAAEIGPASLPMAERRLLLRPFGHAHHVREAAEAIPAMRARTSSARKKK